MKHAKPFRAPLFERLADDEPDQHADLSPYWHYDVDEALRSIRTELSQLLNTRRETIQNLHPLSVIDYGVDDWSAFAATAPQQQRRIERQLTEAIRRFEPRIREPQVKLVPLPGQAQRLGVQVSGTVVGHETMLPVVLLAPHLETAVP
ncbi:type VI secretion system baseplate subunit TssE [Jeongeupia naejangsanensis]|uniref:Type VI secretion system baseplate subunit TssE n=1 Tax=Jeongeupia naejangsanensis TaxID=613195 RepID=A0ABS2BL62_9NEIS|nr:type VI secretion system baseplate subunit TssE [Jeongeupia naejangsanensis]MBM3116352.1 type VI secretion system baseplate subunit TssE [Jeongeupia naejangsanensis]